MAKLPYLIQLMVESVDWKQHLPWRKLFQHATQIGAIADEIDVWTGDDRIGLAAPEEVFDYLKKLRRCGMELFLDSALIWDNDFPITEREFEAVISKWYWCPLEKRLWVGYYIPNSDFRDTIPFEEWELLMAHYYQD